MTFKTKISQLPSFWRYEFFPNEFFPNVVFPNTIPPCNSNSRKSNENLSYKWQKIDKYIKKIIDQPISKPNLILHL